MEDDTPPADSLLPYDEWMEESLRHVIVRAVRHAATVGLPGKHHFYITFRTDYPGVTIPARLREKYPQEMTIVLQHQFRDLTADENARRIGVTLSFGGVSATLSVPLEAISAFVDPSIQYGLRFNVRMPEPAEVAATPEPAEDAPKPDSTPQVVSLDAFRKRKDWAAILQAGAAAAAQWAGALPCSAWAAVAVSLLAACLGVACALAVARAPTALRVLILAALFGLLAVPAPPLHGLPEPRTAPLIIACALARTLALVALFCTPSAAAIPRGLRRAALAAGATPVRAWRDAVLSAVWLPAVIGVGAAWLRQ